MTSTSTPAPAPPTGRLLGASGTELDAYRADGGYRATLEAQTSAQAEHLLAEIERAGLRGRGGAWFPVADKWRAAIAEQGPRVVVANGAEDEPGSRKDRFLLVTEPHLVLDGALLTAAAIGADTVFRYINEHAPEALGAMRSAVAEVTREGIDGGIEISVVAAPATYVAGEDSAAAEFLTTGNAQPRDKPPYPASRGVSDRPTVVSNVETLAHVALVGRDGGDAYRALGTPDCPGTMLVTVPDECASPGVYEVEIGSYLDDLLYGPGGGFVDGPCRGVQVGGPASGWLRGEDLHVPLTPQDMTRAGTTLGCGAIRVLPAGHCAVDAVVSTSEFFAREQCGKCPPCRMTTQFIHRTVSSLLDSKGVTEAHLDKAPELVGAVQESTACALVRFPLAPLTTAREVFAEDFAAHLAGRDCGLAHRRRSLRIEGTELT